MNLEDMMILYVQCCTEVMCLSGICKLDRKLLAVVWMLKAKAKLGSKLLNMPGVRYKVLSKER